MDGKMDGLIPGSPTGRTPRNFRPAWAKDGGTFGPATGAYDGSDPANDFAELSLAGPGGRPAPTTTTPAAPSLGSVGGGGAWGSSGVGFDGGLERRSVSGGAVGGSSVKKTIRLSREQLVAARKPTKVLPEMIDKLPADIVLSMPLSPELLSPMDERTMQRIWQDAASRGGGAGGASRGGGAGAGGQERRGLGRGAGKGGSPGLGPVQGGDSPNFGPIAGGVNWRGNSGGGGGGLRGSNSDPWSKDKKERSPLIGPSGGSSLTSSLDGAFNLDLPADNGRWSRGLKVGELQPATQLKSGGGGGGGFFDGAFGGDGDSDGDGGLEDTNDKGDGMLDLGSLSNAALSFEQEKRRMHDLFAGGDGDGLIGGGFASGLGTGGGSGLLGDPAILSTRAPPPNPTNSRAQALAPTITSTSPSLVAPQQQSHEALSGSVAGLFATVTEKPPSKPAPTQPAPAPVAPIASAPVNVPPPAPVPAPAAPAAAAVETDVGAAAAAAPMDWFYSDPNGNTQGPFKADQMKAWQKAGYFDSVPDLPVRCGNTGPFQPLSSLSSAFENHPLSSANAAASAQQRQQQEAQQQQLRQQQQKQQEQQLKQQQQHQLRQQQIQQQAEAKAQAKKAAEEKAKAEAAAAAAAAKVAAEAEAQEAKAAAEARAQQQKALEQQQREQEQRARQAKNSSSDGAPKTKAPWAASPNGPSSSDSNNGPAGSLAQIQAAEAAAAAAASEGQVDQLKAMLGVSSSSSKKSGGGSAWGGKGAPVVSSGAPLNGGDGAAGRGAGGAGNGGAGGRAGGGKSKSLVEIQQEEARIAAARKAAEPQKSSGGHWAAMASSAPAPSALAKGNLVAWNSVASPSSTSPPPSSSPPAVAAAPAARVMSQQQAPAAGGTGASSGFSAVRSNSGSTAAASGAGGAGNNNSNSSSPVSILESWCGEQLQKLTGSSDMTLIHFCLDLSDPSEIRSYFSAYLGAKPEISHFATEFIKRKHELRHGGGNNRNAASGLGNNSGGKPGQAPQPAAGRKNKKK